MKSLEENRKHKWVETVEGMDFRVSSRKAWKVLNKLTGKTQAPESASSSALTNAIANRIVQVSRVKGPKNDTKEIKRQYKHLKSTFPENDHLSRNFSDIEVDHAIKQLPSGKAEGCDGIYNEFIKNLGPKC